MSQKITYLCKGCNKESMPHSTPGVLPQGWLEVTIKANTNGEWYPATENDHFCSRECMVETLLKEGPTPHLRAAS